MDETILPWQASNWEMFRHYLEQRRIPQALLINGVKGLGKKTLTMQMAKSLLCPERLQTGLACGQCNSCILFKAQTHPDFLTVAPEEEGKIIGIDTIRQLIVKLALKPQFESYRVVLINPADSLNNAAANAFLKCLEEPNERTCMLLVSETRTKLPATILSRCQKMQLAIPGRQMGENWLAAQNVKDAGLLLNLAQGAPLLAKAYADSDVLQLRQQCFSDWLNVARASANPVEIAEKWHKQPVATIVSWLTAWVADMIKCLYHAESVTLHNPDLQTALRELAGGLNLKDMHRFYDALLQSQHKLDTQINKQLMFEELLILWLQFNQGGEHGRSS